FLKMDDEQVQLLDKPSAIPPEYSWQGLLGLHGDELESHYRHILAALGTGSGLTPVIFRKAQNRIQDPAKLRRLVELINGETWIGLDVDVKGSDRKSTRLNSSHSQNLVCRLLLEKKKTQ